MWNICLKLTAEYFLLHELPLMSRLPQQGNKKIVEKRSGGTATGRPTPKQFQTVLFKHFYLLIMMKYIVLIMAFLCAALLT